MKTRFIPLLALTVLVCAGSSVGRSQVISTLTPGSYAAEYIRLTATEGIGQTFRTPGSEAVVLEYFVAKVYTWEAYNLQAFIYEWTDVGDVGSYTFTPPPEALVWSGGSEYVTQDGYGFVGFNIGQLVLDPGITYAFYLGSDGSALHAWGGYNYAADYYDGGRYFTWTRPNESSLPGASSVYQYIDMEFEATFSAISNSISPVPEPGTYATIGLAVCGVIALVQRRRRVKPAATAVAA
jgi:PEP-CTERM putative exosortase interaction domain